MDYNLSGGKSFTEIYLLRMANSGLRRDNKKLKLTPNCIKNFNVEVGYK